MEIVAVYAIVPLAVTSLVIGIGNAVGTSWGLFRHYRVIAERVLTAAATGVLLLQVRTIRSPADAAAAGTPGVPGTLPHSIGGRVVLLLVMVLSTYEPRGLTRRGWRSQQRQAPGKRERPSALAA